MEMCSMKQVVSFNKCYQRYYDLFFWRCTKAVKDETVASGMVQDAFLKLWMLRDHLVAEENYDFLKGLLKKAVRDYYNSTKNSFNANLFRLDDLENPDSVLRPPIEEQELDELLESLHNEDLIDQQRWEEVQQIIPSLTLSQQRLIKLCMKYNFSYDRMSYYLGGISDYVVAKQVEEMLKNLRQILTTNERLQDLTPKSSLVFSGSLDELQQTVMNMRYDLQYSFQQIASELSIAESDVKKAYARAFQVCK